MVLSIALFKSALVITIISMLGACAGVPNEVIGVDGLTISARDLPKANMRRIFVATNREASTNPAIMFSGGRGGLKFAQIDVFIPPTHQIGKVERATTLPPDPSKNFVALDPVTLPDKRAFISALNAGLAELPPEDRNALVFIHGYNTSFDEALFRLAQFVNDTNYNGIAVMFTWPSSGQTTDYLYDLNSVLGSRDELLSTFDAVGQANIVSGDILAHSMGAILTMEALRQAALTGELQRRKPTKLRYIVLASPDIDVNLFAKQLKYLPPDNYEFFVMVSRDDRALVFSKFLSGGISRVGGADIEALNDLGVTVIDLTDVKDGDSNHSKFANSPEIVRAINRSIQSGVLLDDRSNGVSNIKITWRIVGAPAAPGTASVAN